MDITKALLRKLLVGITVLVSVPLASGLAIGSPQNAPVKTRIAQSVEFDVAAIRPSDPAVTNATFFGSPRGVFRASGVTVKDLIEYAYNLRDIQIIGGPGWIDHERYDVNAKSIAASEVDSRKLDAAKRNVLWEADLDRMKRLLADRFQLKCHTSIKDMSVVALVVGKNGPKFHPTQSGQPTSYRMFPGKIEGHDVSMADLIGDISSELGGMLIDNTGLKGQYDIHLEWTPDGSEGDNADAPSLRTALQEQLGLKTERQKRPVEILLVDHIEKPSAN